MVHIGPTAATKRTRPDWCPASLPLRLIAPGRSPSTSSLPRSGSPDLFFVIEKIRLLFWACLRRLRAACPTSGSGNRRCPAQRISLTCPLVFHLNVQSPKGSDRGGVSGGKEVPLPSAPRPPASRQQNTGLRLPRYNLGGHRSKFGKRPTFPERYQKQEHPTPRPLTLGTGGQVKHKNNRGIYGIGRHQVNNPR